MNGFLFTRAKDRCVQERKNVCSGSNSSSSKKSCFTGKIVQPLTSEMMPLYFEIMSVFTSKSWGGETSLISDAWILGWLATPLRRRA